MLQRHIRNRRAAVCDEAKQRGSLKRLGELKRQLGTQYGEIKKKKRKKKVNREREKAALSSISTSLQQIGTAELHNHIRPSWNHYHLPPYYENKAQHCLPWAMGQHKICPSSAVTPGCPKALIQIHTAIWNNPLFCRNSGFCLEGVQPHQCGTATKFVCV